MRVRRHGVEPSWILRTIAIIPLIGKNVFELPATLAMGCERLLWKRRNSPFADGAVVFHRCSPVRTDVEMPPNRFDGREVRGNRYRVVAVLVVQIRV